MRIQPSIDGEPPVAETLAGRPATTGAQRGAALHAGLGAWSDDDVRLKRSTDDAPFWTAHRRTSGYVSDELSEWDKRKYVTERRHRGHNNELLLQSPGDFCMYQETREEPFFQRCIVIEEPPSSLLRSG